MTTSSGMVRYFEAQRENLTESLRFNSFMILFSSVDRLYTLAVDLIPSSLAVFGQFVLMGHKAFLSAASLIGQAQPDDADPITRRAIEMVRVAAALKEDPSNLEQWLASTDRQARWEARDRGERPKHLNIRLQVPHPVVEELMDSWGLLSDAAVHFSPEYFGLLSWETQPGRRESLNYFGPARAVELAILSLTGTHLQILRVLDDCLDGMLRSDTEWTQLMASVVQQARAFGTRYRDRYGASHMDFGPGGDPGSGNATPGEEGQP